MQNIEKPNEKPNNVEELQKFLVTVNYLSKLIGNISEKTSYLRLLLKKDTLKFFTMIVQNISYLKN